MKFYFQCTMLWNTFWNSWIFFSSFGPFGHSRDPPPLPLSGQAWTFWTYWWRLESERSRVREKRNNKFRALSICQGFMCLKLSSRVARKTTIYFWHSSFLLFWAVCHCLFMWNKVLINYLWIEACESFFQDQSRGGIFKCILAKLCICFIILVKFECYFHKKLTT